MWQGVVFASPAAELWGSVFRGGVQRLVNHALLLCPISVACQELEKGWTRRDDIEAGWIRHTKRISVWIRFTLSYHISLV